MNIYIPPKNGQILSSLASSPSLRSAPSALSVSGHLGDPGGQGWLGTSSESPGEEIRAMNVCFAMGKRAGDFVSIEIWEIYGRYHERSLFSWWFLVFDLECGDSHEKTCHSKWGNMMLTYEILRHVACLFCRRTKSWQSEVFFSRKIYHLVWHSHGQFESLISIPQK